MSKYESLDSLNMYKKNIDLKKTLGDFGSIFFCTFILIGC